MLPKNAIAAGGEVEVKSPSSGSTYLLRFRGGVYSCSCVSWKNQRLPINKRSCKHLVEYLGADFLARHTGTEIKTEKATESKKKKNEDSAESKGKKKRKREEKGVNEEKVEKGDSAEAKKKRKREEKREKGKKVEKEKGENGEKEEVVEVKVLLAKKWDEEKHEVVNWWVSEKLDGLRAFWNGAKKMLLTRNGNRIHAPDWFTNVLPLNASLDGELFVKRKAFNQTVSIVRSFSPDNEEWKQVKFMVFDIPSIHSSPFEARQNKMNEIIRETKCDHVVAVNQTLCASKDHMLSMLKEVLKGGGEGLMLRKPKSPYVFGRSDTLLKVKVMLDAEAKVIGHRPGQGKYKGLCGALHCQLPNGKQFYVGTGLSDEQRKHPPAKGETISFAFQELSPDGIPRFPAFRGLQPDR